MNRLARRTYRIHSLCPPWLMNNAQLCALAEEREIAWCVARFMRTRLGAFVAWLLARP